MFMKAKTLTDPSMNNSGGKNAAFVRASDSLQLSKECGGVVEDWESGVSRRVFLSFSS